MKRFRSLTEFANTLERDMMAKQTRLRKMPAEAAQAGVPIVQANVPKATHFLEESVHAEGGRIKVDAPYARDVEFGGEPREVPLADLEKWCAIKGIPIEAAVAIQRKIALDGTPPQPFLERSAREIVDMVAARVKKIMREG